MKSTAKSIAVMRDLKERIDFRIAASATIDTSRAAFDANGYPLLFLSDATGGEGAGQPVILLRMKPVDAVSKDVFGNANVAFTPHTMEFAYELDGGEAEPSRMDIMTVMQEVAKLGITIEIKEIADATAVTEAAINAAAATKVLQYDVVSPMSAM
jgi:hypothetical protein